MTPRRLLGALAAAVLAVLLAAPGAAAHPLGDLSVNRLTTVRVSEDRVAVTWLLDQAEIPTFQERERSRREVLAAKRAEVAERLRLEVDGRPVPLELAPGGRIAFPPGRAGLRTTRVELSLSAAVRDPGAVVLRDGTFPGRVGWRAILAAPGRGTDVRADVPVSDPTHGLRRYPAGTAPPDDRVARLAVEPGSGRVTGPRARDGALETAGAGEAEHGFARLFADAAAGRGVLVFLLLAALGWGALHALSPGHGKAMVAAYLVGTRGRLRDAVVLGATVTVTHTAGVVALGLVALGLSAAVLPEDLYPWLTLVSGLLVVSVGVAVLRSRVRHAAAHRHAHAHPHPHHHTHHHDHDHRHREPGRRGLLAMGVSAGLIPCPSALVVLLAAVAQREIALGLALIAAFSAGLALTLTTLGAAVVLGRRLGKRVVRGGPVPAALRALPALSAAVIVAAGVALTVQALPELT